MARTWVTKTSMLLLRSCREPEPVRRYINKLVDAATDNKHINKSIKGKELDNLAMWVPHPRTRIYYPEGSEHVMDSVPDGAASFTHSYWLRDVDGVEKPQYY